jgi:hypothetical protein
MATTSFISSTFAKAIARVGMSAWEVMELEYTLQGDYDRGIDLSVEAQAADADDEAICGIVNRHEFYTSHEVDNARYDAGFWGSRKHSYRTHCSAKAKQTMIRKRGRV